MNGRLLTIDEAAARLRTPVSTLRFWRHVGTGPVSIKIGRRVMYREGDIESWLNEQFEAARQGVA